MSTAHLKLGKQPRKDDPRTLKISKYTVATPTPPSGWGWSKGIKSWGMMLNGPNTYGDGVPADGLGDCTIAALGHADQVWSANVGKEVTPADSTILGGYEKFCGYVPGNASTDNGGVVLNILNYFKARGFASMKLDAYAAIHLLTPSGNAQGITVPEVDVMRSIWLFGGAYIGVNLPISAQTQKTWHVPAKPGPNDQPGSWGGHCIYLVSYSKTCLTCITWGMLQEMTWGWFNAYCEEAYALISSAWLKSSGVSPEGLNLAAMLADLAYVTS